MAEQEREATDEERAKLREIAAAGRIISRDPVAMNNCIKTIRSGGKPDFTLTKVEVESCWGKNKTNDGGFEVTWGTVSAGFGSLTFVKRDGKLICDAETMGREFVQEVLKKLADDVVIK